MNMQNKPFKTDDVKHIVAVIYVCDTLNCKSYK